MGAWGQRPHMSTPAQDGFHMPAEWEWHAGCWMVWPERADNWRLAAGPAQAAFAAVAAAIARFEPVTVMAGSAQVARARAVLPAAVRMVEVSTNDAWCRDIGPSFVVNGAGVLRGVDWPFNAWGGLQGGLYAPWDLDDAVAGQVLRMAGARGYRAPLIMEGGSLHVDGQGTVLVTEECLLNANRNPHLGRAQIEDHLRDYLGVSKIIWLGLGVPEDETDGHVDNLACFARPGLVLLTWCDDATDPLYAVCRDAEARLRSGTDARGRVLEVERLPMPSPLFITAEEAAGVEQAPGTASRLAGARMAASYVNFYMANGAIIAPAFGVPTDQAAHATLARVFPEREIVMVPAREILLGGGNIHCITQQQPAGTGEL